MYPVKRVVVEPVLENKFSISERLALVQDKLKGSFYTAKIEDVGQGNEIIVNVPNSIEPVSEICEYFLNRLMDVKAFAI